MLPLGVELRDDIQITQFRHPAVRLCWIADFGDEITKLNSNSCRREGGVVFRST